MAFHGAKVALFIGTELLVYLRDDFSHIPYPGCWDFPGGGREGHETPEDCVIRETFEEFALVLSPDQLRFAVEHQGSQTGQSTWFFAAHLPADAEAQIRFGEEGQYWRLIPPDTYLDAPGRIPHLAALLARYLETLAG